MKVPIKMEWTLQRTYLDTTVTLGELLDEKGAHICFTLEDPARQKKIYGDTCIPSGRYRISYTFWEKFKKYYPLLAGIPGYTGVFAHSGNSTDDSEGCILLGQIKIEVNGRWYLRNSVLAKEDVCRRIEAIKVPLYLTIKGGYSAEEMGLA